MEKKEKLQSKWENFWYYYKYHVLAAVFIVVVIGVFIHDKLKQIDYDFKISAVTDYNMTQEQIEDLQKSFEAVADDRNQDGEVHVQISNYTITEEGNANPQVEIANQTKFMADLETGDCMIFIFSDYVYESNKDEGIFDVDEELTKLSACKANKMSGLEDLNIALRKIDLDGPKGDEKLKEYYKDSKKLLERFEKGE